jgi:hypothetical protein
MRRSLFPFLLALWTAPSPLWADVFPNWESCSLDFWQNVSDLNDLDLGVPVEKLGPNAALLAHIHQKEGQFGAAATIELVYARCVEGFSKGNWQASPEYTQYRDCAYQATVDLAALLRMKKGDSLAQIEAIIPQEFHAAIEVLWRNYQLSPEKAAMLSLTTRQACVERAKDAR